MSTSHFITPYGDQMGDGMIQLSLTLPIPYSPKAKAAAETLLKTMGLEKILITECRSIAPEFTFIVAYAQTKVSIDYSTIEVIIPDNPTLDFDTLNDLIENEVGRPLVVIGACIGSDAHTVGIDALFNPKGWKGDWGFERYRMMKAHNMRAQVDVRDLVDKIEELKADVVLVSRVVTQRDAHIDEFKKFQDELKNRGLSDKVITICGGPRVSHELALSLGYHAGFGPGTIPSQVASFIVHEILKRTPKTLSLKINTESRVPAPLKKEQNHSEKSASGKRTSRSYSARRQRYGRKPSKPKE
jgi:beta-lysine 5,6-aminomutase beta subunit